VSRSFVSFALFAVCSGSSPTANVTYGYTGRENTYNSLNNFNIWLPFISIMSHSTHRDDFFQTSFVMITTGWLCVAPSH
jgi:hypothetical protein